jgi:ABC-type multidrug transport system fused ATPase/permease subunit
MAFERISDNLQSLNENIRSFAESSAEYYKLDLFNKTMKGATSAIKGAVIAFFFLFALLFLSIALSVLLSVWIDVPSSGFFIVGGIYLLLGLFIVFFGDSVITKPMLQKTSRKLFNQPEKPEKTATKMAVVDPAEKEEIVIKKDERI